MVPREIIGKDGKKSNMDPKARPAKIVTTALPSIEAGGEPKQIVTITTESRKPPGPPPAKKTK